MQTYNLITQQLFLESSFCHQDYKLFKYYVGRQNLLYQNNLLPFVQKRGNWGTKKIFSNCFTLYSSFRCPAFVYSSWKYLFHKIRMINYYGNNIVMNNNNHLFICCIWALKYMYKNIPAPFLKIGLSIPQGHTERTTILEERVINTVRNSGFFPVPLNLSFHCMFPLSCL